MVVCLSSLCVGSPFTMILAAFTRVHFTPRKAPVSLSPGLGAMLESEREARSTSVVIGVFTRGSVSGQTIFAREEVPGIVAVNKAGMADCRSPLGSITSERALLFQTQANVSALQTYIQSHRFSVPIKMPIKGGHMGEEVLLGNEFSAANLCLGDRIEVTRDGLPVLNLVITGPRRPCSKVDLAFGNTFTTHGVRAHTASTGLAGFFCSVATAGSIMKGDVFSISARPYPAWPLERISRMMYSHRVAVMKYSARGLHREEWLGTQAELVELAGIPELATFEWREELFKLLDRPPIGRYRDGSRIGLGLMSLFAYLPGGVVQKAAALLMERKVRKAASNLPEAYPGGAAPPTECEAGAKAPLEPA